MTNANESWLDGCSETRVYRLRGWGFSLHLSAKGRASLSCPLNRGDLPIHPEQAKWAADTLLKREGVALKWDGVFDLEERAFEAIEVDIFGGAELVHRSFLNHEPTLVARVLQLRDETAAQEAFSLTRKPDGTYFGLSIGRKGSEQHVFGVWAISAEPKDYAPVRQRLFEAFPRLADSAEVAEAVGPQRRIPISRSTFGLVVESFSACPLVDFGYVTASWGR